MAYLRGDYYIWGDGEDRLHVWACDGADNWMDSGWARAVGPELLPTHQHASGVSIPVDVMDEYVMMRFAQLIDSATAKAVIDRALRHGNFGGEALKKWADSIKRAVQGLERSAQ